MEEFLNQYWWGVLLVVFWELGWKGWALWRAAQRNDKAWFVVLLFVNTLGILPIAYLFIFSKDQKVTEQA